MSKFNKSQVISASCNDLDTNYKTNKCIQQTIQINNISFRLQLRLNDSKYIQYHLIANQLPPDIAHIVIFCRLYCNFLTLMGEPILYKQTKLFQNKNDHISWPIHQLRLSVCKKHKKTTQNIEFQCDIQLLQIKEKQYISRFLSFSTSAHVSFEWNITETLINSFKKAKFGKGFYSRDISNIWCLCCYPNGNYNNINSKGSLLLSLQLLRLPIQVSSFQITFLLQCEDKIWMQKKCLFGYDSSVQIWPSNLFQTQLLHKLRSMILKVSIKIDRVSGIDGKEINKHMWNKNKIQSLSQDTEFALDMEIDIDSMTQFTNKQLPQITVADEQKGEEKISMVEKRFMEWLCDELELDKYLMVFQRYDKADMYKVRFLTDITLQEMGIVDEYDQKKILNAVDEFSVAHNTFERILYNNVVLKDYTQQLQMNGIFTLDDIAREIRCKEDIERVFELDESDAKIDKIWNAVCPSSAQDVHANVSGFQEKCKESISKMGEIHQQAVKMENNIFLQGLFSHVVDEFVSNLRGLQLAMYSLQRFQIDSRRTSVSGVDTFGIIGKQKSTSVMTETDANVSCNNNSSQYSLSRSSSIVGQFSQLSKTEDELGNDVNENNKGNGNMYRDGQKKT
eukprot:516038_1